MPEIPPAAKLAGRDDGLHLVLPEVPGQGSRGGPHEGRNLPYERHVLFLAGYKTLQI